jgi:flagellar hook-length control protein FliK
VQATPQSMPPQAAPAPVQPAPAPSDAATLATTTVASMTLTADQTAAALPLSATAPVKPLAAIAAAPAAKAAAKSDAGATPASAEAEPAATAGQPATANPVPPPLAVADATDRGAKSTSDAPAQTPETQSASNGADAASLNVLATAPTLAQAAVQTPGSGDAATGSAIVAQIAAQVTKTVDGKSTRFDISLDPAGLGRVNVKVEIGAQGQVTAQLSFDNAHSAEAAKSQASQLQQALEQAGFNIAQGGLSFDVSGQGAGFAGQNTSSQQQQAATPLQTPDPTPAVASAILAAASYSRPTSGVDITI